MSIKINMAKLAIIEGQNRDNSILLTSLKQMIDFVLDYTSERSSMLVKNSIQYVTLKSIGIIEEDKQKSIEQINS